MYESINIYIGEGDFDPGHPQYNKQEKRREEGWTIAGFYQDPKVKDAFVDATKPVITINGSFAGACVAYLALDALEKYGAESVKIPLSEICCTKDTEEDVNNILLKRAISLATELKSLDVLNDQRLIVTPSKIWSKVKQVFI